MADKIGTDIDDIEERILAGEADRICAQRSAGRGGPACGCTGNWPGLRVLFHRLEQKSIDHLSPALRLQAGKLAQRLDGLDHDIVELRERSRLLEEEMHFKIEEESNRHLHTLSIVTTMLLPPTLVTGIFGMNTKGLPLTDTETGFLWAAAIMVGVAGAAYLAMRRSRHLQIALSATVSTPCAAFFPAPSPCSRRRPVLCSHRSRRADTTGKARRQRKTRGNCWRTAGYQFSLIYIGEGLANIVRRHAHRRDLHRPPRSGHHDRSGESGGMDRRQLPRQHVPDPWRRAVAQLYRQSDAGQRRRGAAGDATL